MTTAHGIRLTAITLNSPDPSALARFYERLLGWSISVDVDGWAVLPNPAGGIGLSFQQEDLYIRPVWPAVPSR